MPTRRNFLQILQIAGASPWLISACRSESGHETSNETYDEAVRKIWRPSGVLDSSAGAIKRELVRLACLAPSSHNSQCWQFGIAQKMIAITPDLSRQLVIVDPDNHHLFVSLGCATENLVQAARAFGLNSDVSIFGNAEKIEIRVSFDPTKPYSSPLFKAIPERQCTRSVFEGSRLASSELKLLEEAGKGDGVGVIFVTERALMEDILALVVQGNTTQMDDPKFVAELKQWIRFSSDQAVLMGDGLYAASSGNRSVPQWLGSPLFDFFFTPKSENEKYAAQVRSSAGIAVFFSNVNDVEHWIDVGRCYERFALQATALGIRTAFLNQPVEVAAIRQQFASLIGIGNARPDLVVRFGRAPKLPQSLRRPIENVLTLIT